MLERLTDTDWTALSQPPWNQPGDLSNAIRRVARAATECEATSVANALLSAVGNNHAGTYYPVVLDVVPFLKEILDEGTDCARTLVLGVLIDLVDTFEPDADDAMIPRATGERASLAEALRPAVCEMHSSIRRIATSDAVDTQQRHWASELDGVLDACCVQATGDEQDGSS